MVAAAEIWTGSPDQMARAIARETPGRVPWGARIGSLLRPAITCSASTTVQQAAAIMARERSSSLLVPAEGGWSVLTEHLLSAGVLAKGRSPRTPLGEVAERPAAALPSDRGAGEALAFMLEAGIHHASVVDADRRVLGVIYDADLAGLAFRSPLALRTTIESAEDAATVARAGRDIPNALWAMVEAGVDPVEVSRMVTLVIESMTRRFAELAIDRLGAPPVPWAWLSLGSTARREQGIVTDQDHALAFDPQGRPFEEVDGYFLDLAVAVTSGLEEAGIPRCKAKVVAEERSLRRPLEHWVIAFNDWMDEPRLAAGRQASILFDYRRSAGPLEAERTFAEVIGSSLTVRGSFARWRGRPWTLDPGARRRPAGGREGRRTHPDRQPGPQLRARVRRRPTPDAGAAGACRGPRTDRRRDVGGADRGLPAPMADPPRTPRGLRPRGARTERQHRPANARAPNAGGAGGSLPVRTAGAAFGPARASFADAVPPGSFRFLGMDAEDASAR